MPIQMGNDPEEQRPMLGEFFNRIPVALYRTTPGGRLVAGNDALAHLLGYPDVATMLEALRTVETIYTDPSQRTNWVEQISDAGVVHEFDVELKRPNGTTLWVQDTARAIRDDHGRIVHYDGALIDVTAKGEARKAKDEFVATVSHELRNPITVIVGLGDELASSYDTFTEDESRELATLIARQAEDASWLIEDLLVAYRDDVSRVSLSPQVFDAVKETERVLEVVDQPVAVEVRGEEARVYADPRRTRQILRNLVSNALRYGGEEVTVRIEVIGDRLELRVCDSGGPIDSEDVERIFRPFERGSGNDHPTSVGLGLSVGRRLARHMNGDLTYRREDGMTCFVLSLPSA